MVMLLDSASGDFEMRFSELLAAKREVSEDVDAAVRAIVDDVRARGDDALVEFTQRFDRMDLREKGIRVSDDDIEAAIADVDTQTYDALRFAHDRIAAHHQRQLPADDLYEDDTGAILGHRWTAVEAAGLYVPGGTASYPSSVLMNAVPAKVAGVERLAMVVPTPDGIINPLVFAAARLAGVDEVYRIGGAQAIAALAFGTEAIKPACVIVGPGNAYVAAAKRQVFGTVGIDMIAGPSEVLVVADDRNDPDWIAADLLAQAEHDTSAQSILLTDSTDFGDAVAGALERQLGQLPRGEIARESWEKFGAIITVGSLDETPALVDRVAPEHLEIATEDPERLMARIRNAGAIFLGRYTPEVIGDYVAGPNHVLPTARSARFSSGLGVLDFMKRSSVLKLGPESLGALAPSAITLAKAEGLDAHVRSVSIRLNRER
jgi:histidinol dehydrogenase